MTAQKTQEIGALVMIVISLLVVAYLAISGDVASQGAMISVLAAGVGWSLRGRVETPAVGTTVGPGPGDAMVATSVTVTPTPDAGGRQP